MQDDDGSWNNHFRNFAGEKWKFLPWKNMQASREAAGQALDSFGSAYPQLLAI